VYFDFELKRDRIHFLFGNLRSTSRWGTELDFISWRV
jgi:hypothetical protein